MEQLIVNRTSGLPPYRQLSGHLSSLIREQRLQPGERLPAVREMVHRYGLSINTVQKALQALKSEGLVVGRQGAGLFVSEEAPRVQSEAQSELWIQPMPWAETLRAGVLNRFHAKFPRARVVESAAANDLQWLEQSFVAQQADALVDVTELARETYGRPEGEDGIFDGLRIGGRLFMMPMSVNTQVMACNAEVFERRGVPLPPAEWDWKEFARTSAALAEAGDGTRGCVFYHHWDFVLPLIWQAGAAVYSEDGRECLLDSEAALEAARHIRRIGAAALPATGLTPAQVYDLVGQGRAAMTVTGAWGYYDLNQRLRRWVARPLPHGRQRATWLSARGYGISRRFPHRNMAMQFVRACAAMPLGSDERDRRPALPLHRELERDGATEQTYRAALKYGRLWLSDVRPERRAPLHLSALYVINRYVEPLLYGTEPVEILMGKLTSEMEWMLTSEEQASGR